MTEMFLATYKNQNEILLQLKHSGECNIDEINALIIRMNGKWVG